MKKTITIILVILLLVSLVGCAGGDGAEYNVTFVLGDGRDPVTVRVASDSELYEPESLDGSLVFAGWFLDADLTRPYLGTVITEDMTF